MTANSARRDCVALAVMARAPSDDAGKTRLLSALKTHAGADLRRAILLDTLDVVSHAAVAADHVVLFTPADAEPEFAQLTGDRFLLIPQRGEGLGRRLECAFADLLARGHAGVLIVGSDLPTLPVSYLEAAASQLITHDDPLVLGPARDGGYYLIALRKSHPELFQGIAWSTATVLETTVGIAKALGLPVSLVPDWYDIDSVDDLQRAVGPASGEAQRALHTRTVLSRLDIVGRHGPADR